MRTVGQTLHGDERESPVDHVKRPLVEIETVPYRKAEDAIRTRRHVARDGALYDWRYANERWVVASF
jgi:hypothetical protein